MSDRPYCLDRRSIYSEPIARYCSLHPPLTAWLLDETSEQIKWVEVEQLRCMHCANAIHDEDDLRDTGCNKCHCDTCPRILSSAYIRYGPRARRLIPRPTLEELFESKSGIFRVIEFGSEFEFVLTGLRY